MDVQLYLCTLPLLSSIKRPHEDVVPPLNASTSIGEGTAGPVTPCLGSTRVL